MNKIASTFSLPDWFQIKNYKNQEKLSLADWYLLLNQRYHLLSTVQNVYNDYKSPYDLNMKQRLHEKPLSKPLCQIEKWLIGGDQIHCEPARFQLDNTGVTPLTARMLYQHENRVPADLKRKFRKVMDRMFQMETLDAEEEEEWKLTREFIDMPFTEAVYKHGGAPRPSEIVAIDTTLPENILVEHFQTYLKKLKEERGLYSSYKKPNPQRWIASSLLPFIDLHTWALEEDKHIPYRVYAEAISENGVLGEENIRKTTLRYFEQTMNYDYLEFLKSVVANDMAEKI